ncbi:MAG: gluconate 2-dehydrogenase subunit 3 family protein [Sediminibacterium sp.]|nr:gluconate 2-dehydrogenase subunit 3 family protein [Sediminibacterium sp.]
MDRRKSLKALVVGGFAGSIILDACKQPEKLKVNAIATEGNEYRMIEEIKSLQKIAAQDKFFNDHELKTMQVLADIIIPKDNISGSASDAKVIEFIEFTVLDQPSYQTPLQGGLKWLDQLSFKKFNTPFIDCKQTQQMEMVDAIAFPKKAKPEMQFGVNFFNKLRDLVVTGFYTSEIGVKDLGYMGNVPNQWNGVPADVLKQYGLSYSEKEFKECVKF